MEAIRRGDQHRVHIGVIDQRVGVAEAQIRTALVAHLVQVRCVHIHHRHHFGRRHLPRQIAGMASAHPANPHHTDPNRVCAHVHSSTVAVNVQK